MKVGALLVVHGTAPDLEATLASIDEQTHVPDVRLSIVDRVASQTQELLNRHGFTTVLSTSTAKDPFTRIGHNFHQGVRELVDCDVVILGDHDDVWLPGRVERQTHILATGKWWMTAADGLIVDAWGKPSGETLRSTFPIPSNWNNAPSHRNLRYALRHSIATGGASAIAPAYFAGTAIPPGWLHDRWWSLMASKHARMHLDDDAVIEYRTSPDQQVGLHTADQDRPFRWARHRVMSAASTAGKAGDIAFRL